METSWGVDNLAKDADIKLTESEERRDRRENVIGEQVEVMQKVAADLEKNKVNTHRENNEIDIPNQKLEGGKWEHKRGSTWK